MKPYLTGFIIGLVWVGFFSVAIGLFLSGLGTNYDANFNQTYIEDFNHLEELRDTSYEIQNSTNINLDEGWTDIIGGYIGEAYKSLKLASKSMTMFTSMLVSVMTNDKVQLGDVGSAFFTAIMVSVIVLIFLGVVISAIFK